MLRTGLRMMAIFYPLVISMYNQVAIMLKSTTCCFTGHRNIPSIGKEIIQTRLESTLVTLIHQGIHHFCAGGALGFDTIAALSVLRLKADYPHICLILVLPCQEQTNGWSEEDKTRYDHILSQADEVIYVWNHYYRGCMHARNRYMVDRSGTCISYLTAETGGTAYTVRYAKQKNVHMINLASNESKDL